MPISTVQGVGWQGANAPARGSMGTLRFAHPANRCTAGDLRPPAARAAAVTRVRHQHGDGHRPDAARHRRDRARRRARRPRNRRRRRAWSCSPVSGAGDAVDADVDDAGAGLHPVALHHLRPPDRRHEDVAAPADGGEIARAAVADRDRAVLREQQLRHRLADDVGAPDDHRFEAGKIAAQRVLRQDDAAGRRAGHERLVAQRRPRGGRHSPGESRRRPCRRSTASSTLLSSMCFGSGSCTRMPCTFGSAFRRSISAEQVGLGGVGGERVLLGVKTAFLGRPALVLHIDAARRVFADENDREARASRRAPT